MVESPAQIVSVDEVTEMLGGEFTVIEMVAESEQFPCVPTTVYMASEEGLAQTESPEPLLKSPAGDHK